MKHLFVPYEIALILKQKGFDEPCLAFYNSVGALAICDLFGFPEEQEYVYNAHYIFDIPDIGNIHIKECAAPLYQQVIDWLREKHSIQITIIPIPDKDNPDTTLYGYRIYANPYVREVHKVKLDELVSYYEALTEAITHALTLIS